MYMHTQIIAILRNLTLTRRYAGMGCDSYVSEESMHDVTWCPDCCTVPGRFVVVGAFVVVVVLGVDVAVDED